MSKKVKIIIGVLLGIIILLVILSKTGAFGDRDSAIEIETAKANDNPKYQTIKDTKVVLIA